jgi:antitoxin component HigA of HigAB toxin-antitoxin module
MSTKTPNPTMAELIREALTNRTESLRAIERATGVKHPAMVNFLSRKRSFHLDSADKLAAYFGIEVRRPRKRRRE